MPRAGYEQDIDGSHYAFCLDCDAHSGGGLPVSAVENWCDLHRCAARCTDCAEREPVVADGRCAPCAIASLTEEARGAA